MSEPIYICKEGTDAWLANRKKYLTASSAYTVLNEGDLPKWWSTTSADIIDDKFKGIEPKFDQQAKRKMWYGSFDEENNMRAAQEMLGLPMARYQWLVSSDKWEFLACTPDAIAIGDMLVPPNVSVTSVPKQVEWTRERIKDVGGAGVVELKNTATPFKPRVGGPRNWFDVVPEYYRVQVQFQLHIMDVKWGVLVGKLGGNDMSCHFIRRDDAFATEMDRLNNKMEEWIEKYG